MVVLLSRLQFAFTVMFHYLFPPLTIGLGVLMVIVEGLYMVTGDVRYLRIARFWTRLFAVNFAMGVASGIVMEFEFGTNWATYSRYVGDVFGSALAAEGIFAFFLESGFLAVLVFAWDRVSPRMHFFSTCMVALGSIFSSVWITVANSWQQTPAGFHIVGHGMAARAEITDFWAMVFNPSSVQRLLHVWLGAFIVGAFFAMSVAAWYILHDRFRDLADRMFKIALVFGTVCSLLMFLSGDLQARKVAHTQPPKLAAFEGIYHTEAGGTPLYLFGLPDTAHQRVDYGIAVPDLLSLLVYHDATRPVEGLDGTPVRDRPPVMIPFVAYHLMVALGSAFVALLLIALYLLWRGTLYEQRWLMWTFVFAVVGPYLANEAGWVAAEVGRQPWIVYGLLRTPDAVSKAVDAQMVGASIVMFGLVYLMLFAVWIYVMNDKIHHGPEQQDELDALSPSLPGTGTGGLLEAAHGGSLTAVPSDEGGK